jgi:hypothetical protein
MFDLSVDCTNTSKYIRFNYPIFSSDSSSTDSGYVRYVISKFCTIDMFRTLQFLRYKPYRTFKCFITYLHTQFHMVSFEVLTALGMKMAVFWDVRSCGVVGIDRRFRGAYCCLE